jgi:hypothetical protein
MGEPTTPAEARRQGLNRARWVATGAAVGTAAILGGVIATVHGAPASSSNSHQLVRSDDGVGDDEYVPAQPFQPQTQTQPQTQQQQPQTQQQSPQLSPQSGSARTRSGGS